MAEITEDIKSRLGVYELISQYVQLKKTGANYKGVCPFHSEKTPSFVVSPEKDIWHCFGCGKGGDIFAFIQEMEGVDFVESLQIAADKCGMKIDNIFKFQKKENKDIKDEYYKAHEIACEFFKKVLQDKAEKAMEYLLDRGLTKETIEEFKIGFAPDSYDELYPLLMKKGISKEVILKSGFASAKKIGADEIYDKFRARIMFPIFDYLGRICGFGGRAFKDGDQPKYLNSPDNPVYNKSKVLYGLYSAKAHIKEKGNIVLTEGYFDMIMPYQAGIKNVVATSGTALTSDHVRLIKRFTTNVTTCFDTDGAGFEATKRAYHLLNKEGFSVKTAGGFAEKDPADYVKAHGDGFNDVLDSAKDFIGFYLDKLSESLDTNSLDGRMKILKEILPLYNEMPPVSRDFYVRDIATRLNVKEQTILDELANFKMREKKPTTPHVLDGSLANMNAWQRSIEEEILGIILKFPKLFEKVPVIVFDESENLEFNNIYKALADQYNFTRKGEEAWDLDSGFLAQVRDKVAVMVLYVEEKYAGFSEEAVEKELGKLIDRATQMLRKQQLKNLQKEIAEAEKRNDKAQLLTLLQKQQELLKN